MAQATSTTLGTVVLGGDLAGGIDANLPQLVASGVIPGTYGPVARWYVNSKGLTVSIGTMTADELADAVASASTTQRGVTRPGKSINIASTVLSVDTVTTTGKGIFSVVSPLSVSSGEVSVDYNALPVASSSVKGIMQVGSGLSASSGVLSVDAQPDATTTSKGIVQVGANLSVSGGVLSADFGSATTSALGIVSVAAPLHVSGGVVSMPFADTTTKGIVKPGTGFSVSSGVLSNIYGAATSFSLGMVKIGSDFENNLGLLEFPIATTAQKGTIIAGSGLQVVGDVLSTTSITDATTSVKGIVQIGSGLDVSSGVVSVDLPDATTSSKGIVQVGSEMSVSGGVLSVVHPDATSSSKGIAQAGSGMSISSGVLSLDTPSDATTTSKGLIQVSSSDPLLSISVGVLTFSFPDATTGAKGAVQVASNGGLSIASGVLSSQLATSSLKGIAYAGSGLTQTGNQMSYSAPDATTGSKGIAQFDSTYFTTTSGAVSLNTASGASTFGVVQPADTSNITVTAGALDVGTNIPKLNTANTYTAGNASALVTASYTATYTPDFSLSNTFEMVLTGNVNITNPTNAVAGGVYTVILTQDGTGGRTLNLSGSGYKKNQTITLSTGANKRDVLTFIYKSSTEIFVLFTPGF